MPQTARSVVTLAALVLLGLDADPSVASDLPRFGLQHQVGETPGFEENFTRLRGFVPLYGETDDWLLFGDLLGSIDNRSGVSSSAGLGLRIAPGSRGGVFGIHTHFDYREFEFAGGDHDFHRWGIGVEALGEVWAARGNAYMSTSSRRPNGIVFNHQPRFIDRYLLLGTAQKSFAESFHGVDFEISRLVPRPFGLPIDHEIGAGAYYWDTPRSDGHHAPGVKGRVHTWLTDSLLTYVHAAHDRVFETSVNAGFIWYFGGPSTRPSERVASLVARMATPIQRQYEIPVLPYVDAPSAVYARDPISAERITFTHVDDDAAPGGLGTWERPFSRLETASFSGTDIVLVQNGTYSGDFILLSAGQRLLAVNKPHFVETERGIVQLPRTGIGGSSSIVNSPDNAITLASNTEVVGFTVTGASGSGIFGTGNRDVALRCNTIRGSGENAILLLALAGTGEIEFNRLHSSRLDGLRITAVEADLRVTGNTAESNGLHGLAIEADSLSASFLGNTAIENGRDGINIEATVLSANVSDNVVSDNATWGIQLRALGGMTGDFHGNTAINNGVSGIFFAGDQLDGSIVDNIASSNGWNGAGSGISVIANRGITGDLSGNTADGNSIYGIHLQTFGATSAVGGDVRSNQASSNILGGIGLFDSSGGGVAGSISQNTTNDNRGGGIIVFGGPNAQIIGNVSNNTANENGASYLIISGIRIALGLGVRGDVLENTANHNWEHGIELIGSGSGADFTGDVLSNTTNGNRGDGFFFTIPDEFTGSFTGNTANSNDRYGFNTSAGGTVTGTTTGNQASGNGVADFNGNIAQP